MSEKVKVTREQAELLDRFQEMVNDTGISTEAFIYAFENGYEVEPEFNCGIGDWIKDTSTGAVFQIKDMQHRNNTMDSRYTTKRHAIESEIKQEKERRTHQKIKEFLSSLNEEEQEIVKGKYLMIGKLSMLDREG